MYFWNINQLKSDLASRRLPRRDVFMYLIAILVVQTAECFFPLPAEPNVWDTVGNAAFVALSIVGTGYCYYASGSLKGIVFWERYLSLAWVFGLRYTLCVSVPSFLGLGLILYLYAGVSYEMTWCDVLLYCILLVLFFVRLSSHICSVAQSKISTNNSASGRHDLSARPNSEESDQLYYPGILRRYMATFIDGVFVLSSFVAVSYIFQEKEQLSVTIRLWLTSFLFFLYEPLCTSKLCTLGQKLMGIRVRSTESGRPISIMAAYLRIIVKVALGMVSFFSIPLSTKRRGIHDFAAGSVVVYATKDLSGIS